MTQIPIIELYNFVDRADTLEKCKIAYRYIRRLKRIDPHEQEALLEHLRHQRKTVEYGTRKYENEFWE